MTNEETIKELSDALEATTKERLNSEKDNLQRTIFIYDRLKFIRNQLTINTVLLGIIAIILLCSCTHKETEAERLEREYQVSKIKTEKVIDSIDNELLKLGVKDEPGR